MQLPTQKSKEETSCLWTWSSLPFKIYIAAFLKVPKIGGSQGLCYHIKMPDISINLSDLYHRPECIQDSDHVLL